MQIPSSINRLVLVFALLTATCARPISQPVQFAMTGGDAWSVEKSIAGLADRQLCDTVLLTTPLGSQHLPVQNDGRFSASVALQPGSNRLQAECRSKGETAGPSATQFWEMRLSDHPRAVARLRISGGNLVLDGSESSPTTASKDAIARHEWRQHPGNPEKLHGLPAAGEAITVRLPKADGEYRLTLRITDEAGRNDESTAILKVSKGRAAIFDPMREHAAWIDEAVIYGVVPFLFGSRGFDDVTARLDDLASLGITALLLSPVKAAPEGDYGYAVTNYFALNPRYGTEEDWREFIAAAHQRGLRVIMDLVPNHTSDQHPYFVGAQKHRHASPYFEFFARDASGAASHYFDWENLKNLNLDHPEVQNFLIEASAYWVRRFGIDGFRVDVAWGPRERRPDFWPRWAAELHRMRPDLLLLAEASARDPYYAGHGFDAAYDWTEELGRWAWKDAFENEGQTATLLRQALAATPTAIPVFRFLNNNDTGRRFITRYGLPRTRVASAMLLTLPGLPALFSGDDVGAAFQPYDDPPPINWNEDPHNLRLWYAHLIRLRQQNAALRSSTLQLLDTGSDSALAYMRPSDENGESIVVLLNYGAEPVQVDLPQEALGRLLAPRHQGRVTDLLNGATLRLQNGRRVSLPGYGVRILRAL